MAREMLRAVYCHDSSRDAGMLENTLKRATVRSTSSGRSSADMPPKPNEQRSNLFNEEDKEKRKKEEEKKKKEEEEKEEEKEKEEEEEEEEEGRNEPTAFVNTNQSIPRH
jgi:hypothetical protein